MGNFNAILIVTHRDTSLGEAQPFKVEYDVGLNRWWIGNIPGSNFAEGTIFNVLVVKP